MTPAEVALAEPASPELFKRLCSGSPSLCVAKIDNLTVLAPIVGRKIDRGNWVFTDTVRYSWCTSSTCYYVGTVNVYTTGPFQRTGHNHVSDTGSFWYDFRFSWNASGCPGITWNYGTFTSFHFRCNNTSGCYFP